MKTPTPHRIAAHVRAQYDKPGNLLAAASWPEGGTCIILDDFRVRTYYGTAIEAMIAVGPVTAFWMREELALLRKSGDAHRTTPGDILTELDAALDDILRFDELNPECLALHTALVASLWALRKHATEPKPRVPLKEALRALDAALVPFGVSRG